MTPLEISCEQTAALRQSDQPLALIDCREQAEFDIVHIEGAQLLPMSEITTRLNELSDVGEQTLVVYCHHGGRSAQVAQWLRQQGFESAQSMAGGIDQWALEVEPGMARY